MVPIIINKKKAHTHSPHTQVNMDNFFKHRDKKTAYFVVHRLGHSI